MPPAPALATGREGVLARLVIERSGGDREVAWLVGPASPDLSVVDALARLQLACRRRGDRLHLEEVSDNLADLIELSGLRAELEG